MSWAGSIERDPALFAHYSMLDFLINEAAAGRILRKETGLLLVALAKQTREPVPCFQPDNVDQCSSRAGTGMPGIETGFLPLGVSIS